MSFDLKIGFKCNNDCVHCVVADKRQAGNMDVSHLYSIIDSLPKGETVQITGGEPTIFSYLPDILRRCKDRHLFTVIQTNGTGFSDKAFFDECAPYIDHIHMAIHSCYPEVHDAIVKSKGMWEKTIKGFGNVISSDVYCSTQTVLSKYNIDGLYDTFKFIQYKKKGIQMSMTYPHMMGNAYKNRFDIMFRYSDKREVIQKTLNEFGKYIFVEAIPPCHIYPYEGELFAYYMDDILHGTDRVGVDFSNGFNEKNYNYEDVINHRKAPRCKDCVYTTNCIGVWKEYIELFSKNLDILPITR